jgi:hypothetical protein
MGVRFGIFSWAQRSKEAGWCSPTPNAVRCYLALLLLLLLLR